MPLILDAGPLASSPFSVTTSPHKMGLSKLFSRRNSPPASTQAVQAPSKSPSSRKAPSTSRNTPSANASASPSNMGSAPGASINPFSNPTPTRRPQSNAQDSAPPPAYSPAAPSAIMPGHMQTTADSKYAFLTQFDTVFLIDDSGSMAGRSW